MFTVLTILFVLGFTVLAWYNLRLACFFILATLPLYLIRFHIGPIPLTLLEPMLLATVLVWLLKKGYKNINQQFVVPILILFFAATIGIFVAPDTVAALGIWKSYFVEPTLFFFVLSSVLNNRKDVYWAITSLSIGALFVALFALFQKITGIGIPEPWDLTRRATSIFQYPNAVGLYLAPIIGLGVVTFWKQIKTVRPIRSVFWILFITTAALAVIFSQTEAVWVAIPASLWIVSWIPKKTRHWSIPAGIAIILILLLIPTTSEPILNKVLLQDYSGGIRLTQWSETLELLKDKPMFGAGLSGYPTAVESYHQNEHIEIFQYPHNIFLNTWVEIGLIGLVGLFALVIESILRARTGYKRHRKNRWIVLGCLVALLITFVHGLVDVPYFKNDLAVMTWSIFAILASTNKKL
jgi:O-antigen ligase